MKILHVWDIAGVSVTLTKFMDRMYATNSSIMMRRAFDPFNFVDEKYLYDSNARDFLINVVFAARKYDMIHIHSIDNILFLKALRFFYYKKPIVLHYHGTDIRDRWIEKRDRLNYVNAILVSTPDLLDGAPEGVIYLPNPIDTDLFKPTNNKEKGKALHISYGVDEEAKKIANEMNLQLTIHDRKVNPIPYKQMPSILTRYEYYIDIRKTQGKVLYALSKTGLEALACNTKLITYDKRIIDRLPEEHKAENVVKRLWNIYASLLST